MRNMHGMCTRYVRRDMGDAIAHHCDNLGVRDAGAW